MTPVLSSAARRRTVLALLALLLLLDLGRSIYARLASTRPAEASEAEAEATLTWPPGRDLPADTPLGERVYVERCAVCHGLSGDGNGPAAPSLVPRPRDFTAWQFKYKTTPAGAPPSDADLVAVVDRGLAASAMPAFADLLSEAEIAAVVGHVKGLSPLFADDGEGEGQPQPEKVVVPPRVPPDAASLARGRALYQQGCDDCHGVEGRGRYTPLEWILDYGVRNRDLTAPWTFRGGSEPEQIWLRLYTGMVPGPMPAYADVWSADELWDVVNYVVTLARTPPWETGGRLDGPGQQPDPVKRGDYLVHAAMCGLCHTSVDSDLSYTSDPGDLAGGMEISIYPHGIFVSPNLTADPETGLGAWSGAEIVRALRDGRGRSRSLNPWAMPWQFFHGASDDDAHAIAAYLAQTWPVPNETPRPLHYGAVETAIAKLLHSTGLPPIGNPSALVYRSGNLGSAGTGEPLSRFRPQELLVDAQWLVLLAATCVLLFTGRGDSRRGSRAKLFFALAGAATLGVLGFVLYATPVLPFVPPAQIHRAATAGIPVPDLGSASAEQRQLVERGRYLFTVTSCAFCHGAGGSGGAKISSRAFGTLWVSNITPDADTGIGSWSDAEIARALRSGISRDGRALHWQGMIWDHLSNLDEEDVRALIAYLRELPAVESPIPAPMPPGPGDCANYTFFLRSSDAPGCE